MNKFRPILIVVPFTMFVICFGTEIYFVAEWWRWVKETKIIRDEGIQTTGTIVALKYARHGYSPTIEFNDPAGTKREFKGRYRIDHSWNVGEKIALTYAANDPKIVLLDDNRKEIFCVANIVFMLVVLNFGMFLGGAGTIGMIQEIRSNARRQKTQMKLQTPEPGT